MRGRAWLRPAGEVEFVIVGGSEPVRAGFFMLVSRVRRRGIDRWGGDNLLKRPVFQKSAVRRGGFGGSW